MVVSLVGIMHGTPKDFEAVQWKGAANVARAAHDVGAKLIHVSAIGADLSSDIPYARTKALAEHAVLDICPDVTIIRPSIVFGPGDDFFNVRFWILTPSAAELVDTRNLHASPEFCLSYLYSVADNHAFSLSLLAILVALLRYYQGAT